MFGRKNSGDGARAAVGLLGEILGQHHATEQMKAAARSSARAAAIFRPQIPIGQGPSAGWFGGDAKRLEG